MLLSRTEDLSPRLPIPLPFFAGVCGCFDSDQPRVRPRSRLSFSIFSACLLLESWWGVSSWSLEPNNFAAGFSHVSDPGGWVSFMFLLSSSSPRPPSCGKGLDLLTLHKLSSAPLLLGNAATLLPYGCLQDLKDFLFDDDPRPGFTCCSWGLRTEVGYLLWLFSVSGEASCVCRSCAVCSGISRSSNSNSSVAVGFSDLVESSQKFPSVNRRRNTCQWFGQLDDRGVWLTYLIPNTIVCSIHFPSLYRHASEVHQGPGHVRVLTFQEPYGWISGCVVCSDVDLLCRRLWLGIE